MCLVRTDTLIKMRSTLNSDQRAEQLNYLRLRSLKCDLRNGTSLNLKLHDFKCFDFSLHEDRSFAKYVDSNVL